MNVEIKDVKANENDVNTVEVNTVADDKVLDNIIQDLNNRCIRILSSQQEEFKMPFRASKVGRGMTGIKQSHNIILNMCDIIDGSTIRKGLTGTDKSIFSLSEDKSSVIRDMHIALEILRAYTKGCK